jgi:hypothetical protein
MARKVILSSVVAVIIIAVFGYIFLCSKTSQSVTLEMANQEKLVNIQETPEDTVKNIASAYWEAAKYNDHRVIYDFLSPDDKKLISKEDYIKKQSEEDFIVINNFTIESVYIEGNIATVRITIDANTGTFPGTTTFVLIDGKWYKMLSEENKRFLGI